MSGARRARVLRSIPALGCKVIGVGARERGVNATVTIHIGPDHFDAEKHDWEKSQRTLQRLVETEAQKAHMAIEVAVELRPSGGRVEVSVTEPKPKLAQKLTRIAEAVAYSDAWKAPKRKARKSVA